MPESHRSLRALQQLFQSRGALQHRATGVIRDFPRIADFRIERGTRARSGAAPFPDARDNEMLLDEGPQRFEGVEVARLVEEFETGEEAHQRLGVLPELFFPHQCAALRRPSR